MKVLALFASFFFASTLVASVAKGTPVLDGKIQPNGYRGILISAEDLILSNGSRVCFTAPDWSKVYLRSVPHPNRPPILVEKLEDGYKETIAPVASTGMVSLTEYAVRCKGNKGEVTLRADVPSTTTETIVVEHVAFVIKAGFLEGAEYEILDDEGKKTTGVIPFIQKNKAVRKLLPLFRKAVFRTDLGTLTIEVHKGPMVKMDDRRSAIFEGHGPAFIVWSANIPLSETGYCEQQLSLTYDYPKCATGKAVSMQSSPVPDVAWEPEKTADFPLLPRPASTQFFEQAYSPAIEDRLAVIHGSEKLLRHAAKLAKEWGLSSAFTSENDSAIAGIKLIIGDDPEGEGYELICNSNGIVIQAEGERAGFYALQTLRGLFRDGAFRAATIKDKPAFKLRIVHAMADADTYEHLQQFISKVLAPLKINTILLECPYVKWNATEGMWDSRGMEKADLIKLLQVAKENYIKVYPLVPTYSHSEWLFKNDKNLEMIDNPRDKTAYNPLHPEVYPFLTRLFEEILETFDNPEYFHISHDELVREYPQRPEGKAIGVKKLFLDDVMWHYNFFKKRNIKVMMWHDMLVSKQETTPHSVANAREGMETLRKVLPKDLNICVWNYSGQPDGTYPEVETVRQDGFPIFGAGWYSEGNLESLAETCRRNHAEGMIVTTWHWKFNSGGLLYTQFAQMHSYIRAASLFWNPDDTTELKAAEILVDLLRTPEQTRGVLHTIPVTGNILLNVEKPEFESLHGESVRTLEKLEFALLRDREDNLSALSVNSRRLPQLPAKVRIPLKAKYQRLHLLHTLLNRSIRNDGISVKLVFRYADDTYEAVYLRNNVDVTYGAVPIFNNDGKMTYRPDEVGVIHDLFSFQRNQYNCISWVPPAGKTCRIWSYTWKNPHPEKELDHLLIEAQNLNTTYCLLGLLGEKLTITSR